MPQTFCYLCIKKPLTLPHTPLRILKHRKKTHTNPQKHEPEERTTKERPKARTQRTTKSTNPKNDQKHEPRKERPKARTRRTSHEKNDQKNEPEKRTTKSTTEKHESKSTNPAPMFQARLPARCLQARLSKPQSTASAPNRFLAPQSAILPLS